MGSLTTRSGQVALALVFAAALGGCTPARSEPAPRRSMRSDAGSKRGEPASGLAHPVNFSSGITTSNQSYFQQNAPATTREQVPVKAPGSSEVDVQCQVNTRDRTVVYAYAAPSGTVSDSREWLKNVGWCHGVPATTTAPPVRAEE